MMLKVETKEDFDELMLGQKKFNDFIRVNQLRKGKYKCATDQKILINKLIQSKQMSRWIICDFNKVLARTDIFDFTNEDDSTTVKLNEWHEYIANSAIKDFNALLKNQQIHFSDDNGGPLRFACWISRLNSSSIKNFNDVLAKSDITFEKYNNFGYVTLNEFKDKLADGSIKNLDFIIEKNGAIKEDKLGFKDFIKDATNLKYFAPEAFDRIDLNNPEHRELLCIKSNEDSKKFIELMQKMSSNLIKDSNKLSINDDIKLNKSGVIYTASNELQDNLSNKPIKSSTETENYVQIIQIEKTEKREYTHAIFNKPIENFNDILAREDITFEKSNGSYATFNEFKDKLANGSIKNLDFIIEKNGAIKEDKLKFTDFIKDTTNLKYFSPEAFDRIDLNNLEHRSLLGIKSKEEPDKIVFGWNLLGYLSIVFTFGFAYVFGWAQKLFANAAVNDWYNGSYIARLQERKKDIEIVVKPIKMVESVSMQSESKQWDSKSDDGIIQSQVKKILNVFNAKFDDTRNNKHEENTTKNSIDIINTNKKTLNGENEFEQKPINNKQKENKNIKKGDEIIKSTTKKTPNTDYSNNNDPKITEASSSKQIQTDQSTQINKNIDLKTEKNIIKNNNESGKRVNEPSNKQTKTGQSTQVNKNVELKHEKNIAGNSTNTIKMDNKVLNSKNDNKNESGQKIVNSSKKGNNQTTKKDDIHKQELSKGHNTKKDQTAKNNNSEKMHVPQDEKKSTNEAQKHKQNYGVADFLADFNDATNMNFIFLDNQDAQRQLQDKLSKLDECKTKYNEILEVNKDALQKYESKHKIKIVNTIDCCMKDTKLELDNRQKKLGALQFKNFYPAETPSLNKPFLAINSPFQNSANSNLNSPFFNPCPPPYPFNNLYQDQKPYMINETEMGNNLFENNPYFTKKPISKPPQTKEVQKLNYIVDEEDEII